MIAIIGLGFVGGAIFKSFKAKGIKVIGYDKYKNGGIGSFQATLSSEMVILCLPTLFNETTKHYNKDAIHEICSKLEDANYKGLVVIKSTIEPETTNMLADRHPSLTLCHNPEFLSARTAYEDFQHQKHIVLGKSKHCSDGDIQPLVHLYTTYYPFAEISVCTSLESESMKIMCNSFYASKIILFNEYYLLCKKNGANFDTIRNLMLKNEWINPMHTKVPGTDSKLGYGGACFPKDTHALCHYMKSLKSPNEVLESVVLENSRIRNTDELSQAL